MERPGYFDRFDRSRGRRRSHSLGWESDHSLNRFSRASGATDDYYAHAVNDGKSVTVTVYLTSDYDSKRPEDSHRQVRSGSAGSAYDPQRYEGYDSDHRQHARFGRKFHHARSRSASPNPGRHRYGAGYGMRNRYGTRFDMDREYEGRYSSDDYQSHEDSMYPSRRRDDSRSRSLRGRMNPDSMNYYPGNPLTSRNMRSRSAYPGHRNAFFDHSMGSNFMNHNGKDNPTQRHGRSPSINRFDGRRFSGKHDGDETELPGHSSDRMRFSRNFSPRFFDERQFSQGRRSDARSAFARQNQKFDHMSESHPDRLAEGGQGRGFQEMRYPRDASRGRFATPPTDLSHRRARMYYPGEHRGY